MKNTYPQRKEKHDDTKQQVHQMTSTAAAKGLMESLVIRCQLTGKVCSAYAQGDDDTWSCDLTDNTPTSKCPKFGPKVYFLKRNK